MKIKTEQTEQTEQTENKVEQKGNILFTLLKGKSVAEAELLLYGALKVIKWRSTIN
mgnify:CR=1 FL=1|tara:strand:+ start:2277 stop:2444 length:168 start_codon:yes stop_codon:yes gene_type:complete